MESNILGNKLQERHSVIWYGQVHYKLNTFSY